jgi:hypothetical protein
MLLAARMALQQRERTPCIEACIMMKMRFGKKLKLPSTVQIKRELLVMWLADQRTREADEAKQSGNWHAGRVMDRAANYRRRADLLDKTIRQRTGASLRPLKAKQIALTEMANNEDWLDGKPGTAIRT